MSVWYAVLATALALLGISLGWQAITGLGRAIRNRRARLVEPDTHGDIGGWPDTTLADSNLATAQVSRPKAPDIGSGLPAGAGDYSTTLKPWKAGHMEKGG